MSRFPYLEKKHKPDWEALIANLKRRGTPKRVHHMELFHDNEIIRAILQRYNLEEPQSGDPREWGRREFIAYRRFLGFDYVRASSPALEMPLHDASTEDTAALKHKGGRSFRDEHTGPITNWDQFATYPWPDPNAPNAMETVEWFQKNLPDDMCIQFHTGSFHEYLTWLMGYETLCYALFDNRDLVRAIADKLMAINVTVTKRALEYDRVQIVWGSDDMGFKNGLLISPADTREFALPGHKKLARMAHDAGRVYVIHSCGKLADIMDDLIDDVKIDGKHSFEDTIEDVRDAKRAYGLRTSLIGGIDMDFICRHTEDEIRQRVRDTLDVCLPGGGYCLGTGNTVANYIPLEHYLAMVDEGWKYSETL